MEATDVYWVPVWNVLEKYGFDPRLINPEHYKAVRGKKTDFKASPSTCRDSFRGTIHIKSPEQSFVCFPQVS